MLLCYNHVFSNFWLPRYRWGKWITNFFWHDLLLRLSGGLGIFYAVKWNLADNVVSEDRCDFAFPCRQSVKPLQNIGVWVFQDWKWRSLELIFEVFADSHAFVHVILWFLLRTVIFLCLLTDADWKWQSQGYQ